MNVEKLLEDFYSDSIRKGIAFEELAYLYYKTQFDNVIKTDKMDKGVDLILFNDLNRLHRIGVQIKNQESWIRESQIVKMHYKSKDYYGLSELWLVSKSDVKYSAQGLIKELNIKVKQGHVDKILQNAEKGTRIDTRDIHRKICDIVIARNIEEGVYYKLPLKTIDKITKVKPKKLSDLDKISGLGDVTIGRYGQDIINLFK